MFDEKFKEFIDTASTFSDSDLAEKFLEENSNFYLSIKIKKPAESSLSRQDTIPPDARDLARLLSVGRLLRPISALEFGSGYSTGVLAEVMQYSKNRSEIPLGFDRSDRPYVLYSVDESEHYLAQARNRLTSQLSEHVEFFHARVALDRFNGRYCTAYDPIPNCLPDFIYLDGPSQFASRESIRGFSLANTFRMPMAADILAIENFLEPGCVVMIDGRTANARFLLKNLQRDWLHHHDERGDYHLLIMNERPLGGLNLKRLQFRGLL
jgi:hypothetical protein